MKTAAILLMLAATSAAQPLTISESDTEAPGLRAVITSGHEQVDEDGTVKVERTPFEVYDRIKLDASGSTGANKYLWGVFVDFDVSPDDMAGKAPTSVINAVRTVEEYGGRVSLPVNDRGGIIQEYDGGTVLDLLPIPGTYYVTLTAIADNDGDQVQAVIRVNPYPGQTPRPPPGDGPDDGDTAPPPPGADYDFSDEAADWLTKVPAAHRGGAGEVADLCLSFADDEWANSRGYLDAKFGIGAALALGNDSGAIDAWQPFFEAMNQAFGSIPDSVGLEDYRAAYVSVGKGLEAAH